MIRIEALDIVFKEFSVRDIDLTINRGEFFCLIGPTGAGKTILLESIVGILPVSKGRVFIDDRDITMLPPEMRNVGIVYQDYALFPHLTVIENIRYGLKFHSLEKKDADQWLAYLIDRLELHPLINRYPKHLSGGEQQRAALGRALMVKPDILLLDEPLSALDPGFREQLRLELKHLHRETSITFLMVTHDFPEVLCLADRVAVINKGRIEQTGAVREIFETPATPFVAEFVGMKNLFSAAFSDGKAMVAGDIEISLGRHTGIMHGFLAIRPEDIVISRERLSSSIRNAFRGSINKILNQGFFLEVWVKVGQIVFNALITKGALIDLALSEGEEIWVSFKSTAIHIFGSTVIIVHNNLLTV